MIFVMFFHYKYQQVLCIHFLCKQVHFLIENNNVVSNARPGLNENNVLYSSYMHYNKYN